MSSLCLGIDVGSTTVKVVALSPERELLDHTYVRSCGRPRPTLVAAVKQVLGRFGTPRIASIGVTGSGGAGIAALLGVKHVNELIAQTRAVARFHPEGRTVIEIGGQDSKLLSLEREPSGEVRLVDFAMNALCAAGTGAFLDQQAERLGIAIDGEFAELALASGSPARIAGRCTVFAKSDMIHLQQQGVPLADILMGLCLALARNFKAVIGRGKSFVPPVLFQGGVAYNGAVVRAFEEVLGLEQGQIIVPEHHCLMAALGAAYEAMDEGVEGNGRLAGGVLALEEAVRAPATEEATLPPLARHDGRGRSVPSSVSAGVRIPAYLGIDVGSISTCAALVDEDGAVVGRRYLMTAGRPLEAVRTALLELGAELGDRVRVEAVGTTGSGRYLTGDFVGADVVRNEITAQARAAVAADPAVDTLIEIGGQDSKYARISHGAVVDFTMNHACAAGTGSFLEEQAERLRISVQDDFSRLALSSRAPVCLGERCTVFMESDLVHHQQQAKSVEDLTAGLSYSIAENYLNRVLDGRKVGGRVLFQGGVAANDAVVSAFEQLLQRPVTVPAHHDVSGAIGAALLAREEMRRRGNGSGPPPTRFRGFDLTERTYASETFECRACPNLCQVSRVKIGDEPPIFYGARCDRFEEAGRGPSAKVADIPDLFAERRALLMGDYVEPEPGSGRLRIGMPSVLLFHDMFPYWRTFFAHLGHDLVLSDPTNPRIVRGAQEGAAVETCFPVKLVFGHVDNLLEKGIDQLFLPSVINRENSAPGQPYNQYCPYVPAVSHLVTAQMDLAARGVRALKVPLEMSWVPTERTQLRALGSALGVTRRRIVEAARAAEAAQAAFYDAVRRKGEEALGGLEPGRKAVVLVGRPYNTQDLGASMDLPLKLRRLGALPIPMDFLPLRSVDVSARYGNMFWRSGQDILAAATLIRDDPRLLAIYVTNFNCGPDSFLTGFFRRIMADKPHLELEIDDHTADAGLITRCEAFLESAR